MQVQAKSSNTVTSSYLRPPIKRQHVINSLKFENDRVRARANHVYGRTMSYGSASALYDGFFSETNLRELVSTIETRFGTVLDASYIEDVVVAMLQCFAYHASTLEGTNELVLIAVQPKLQALNDMRTRYQTNLVENEGTKFLHFMDHPRPILSDRRNTVLSFSDALFGVNDRNAKAFEHFKLR